MYLPAHFAQQDVNVLQALMRDHPLATLVADTSQGLSANHVPLLYDSGSGTHGMLLGHVARANPLWQEAAGREVLAIFHGPQAYVTPSWYASKAEHGKVVPTWNYAVVHAHGTLRVIEDKAWLRGLVVRLTKVHEASRRTPWSVSDAPPDFVEQMLGAIVGLEIPLTRLVGKWKASQNRPAADRAGVAAGLSEDGQGAAASLVPR
jgi:transcriptional regulator